MEYRNASRPAACDFGGGRNCSFAAAPRTPGETARRRATRRTFTAFRRSVGWGTPEVPQVAPAVATSEKNRAPRTAKRLVALPVAPRQDIGTRPCSLRSGKRCKKKNNEEEKRKKGSFRFHGSHLSCESEGIDSRGVHSAQRSRVGCTSDTHGNAGFTNSGRICGRIRYRSVLRSLSSRPLRLRARARSRTLARSGPGIPPRG